MAKDRTTPPAPDPAAAQPSADRGRTLDALHTDVAKIQVDGAYTKQAVGELRADVRELRADMRDVRDRITKLEVRVEHLPSKGFIVLVVTTALVIAGGLVTIAPKLSSWAGTQAQAMSVQK